jgi:release factor glutamine methyltransferase
VENGRLDAENILSHVLGLRRLDLYLQHDRPLQGPELKAFKTLLLRRAAREPLQYVLGRTSFRELELATDPRALIPRPETEVLVGEVLAWAVGVNEPTGCLGSDVEKGLRAVDVGTGTGAIALSLLSEGPFREVVATDASAEALNLARENALALGVLDGLDLRNGRGLEPLGSHERFDAIVSNPPYIPERDLQELAPEIRQWEPMEALLAGREGLDVLIPLVFGAPRHLREGGLLALEVGHDQAQTICREAERSGNFGEVRVVKDLAGRDRIVLAERS